MRVTEAKEGLRMGLKGDDEELAAMKAVADVLGSLDEKSASRVVRWAADRFGLAGRAREESSSEQLVLRKGPSTDGDGFQDAAELFVAAGPSTEEEKVLVMAYWFQVAQAQEALDGISINNQLKNLGHGVSNVTRAFDRLIARRPQLAIQVRKAGRTKQARKKYRITTEGIRRVQAMISGVTEEEA